VFKLSTMKGAFSAVWPGEAERRLHNRALAYWSALKSDYAYPLVEQFDFCKFETISSHGFLLDLFTYGEPTITFVGDVLGEEAECFSLPARLKDISEDSLLGQFAGRWSEIATTGKPQTSEYVFETFAGYRVFCRGVLLPLSDLGTTVDCIFGVISWKSEKIVVESYGHLPETGSNGG
jgi:hypothetical protein